jgi:hypothetical protein
MNNRQRKKWLKQHRLYVNPKETWSLDVNLAKYIIPRLKKFKELNNGYPGISEMDTHEKWDEALDKMIQAFEYVIDLDEYWLDDPRYDYTDIMFSDNKELYEGVIENKRTEDIRRLTAINEGLQLFAKYYMNLWW